MRMKALALLGSAVIVAASLAPAARAEQNVPGSVIVFPYVNTSTTVISITNTYLVNWEGPQAGVLRGGHELCVENDPQSDRIGDTAVHLIFFQKSDNPGSNCIHSDFFIPLLTAQDHTTFVPTDIGFPAGAVGWMVAFASVPNSDDPDNTPLPWAFDFLAGQAWNVNSGDDFSWSYNGYPYLSRDWAVVPADDTPCDRTVFDSDEFLDFNLVGLEGEYEQWGDELILPRFFEESNDGADKDSLVALISPLNSFEDQRNFKVTFSTLFWDNDENGPFSRTTDFRCAFWGSMRDISAMAADLGGTAGAPEQPTGWALFDGFSLKDDETNETVSTDPPLLGVFAQFNTPGDARFHTGANMFTRGFNYDKARIQYLFGVQ